MKNTIKLLGILAVVVAFSAKVYAQPLTYPYNGGTGIGVWPVNSIITSGTQASGVFQATSTQPLYIGSLFGTTTSNSVLLGKLGIGSTTPIQALSIQGNGLFSGNIQIANLIATGTLTVSGTASSTFTGGIDAARVCITGTTTCLAPASATGVTSVATNNGITGGTITTTGTIGLDLSAVGNPFSLPLTLNGSNQLVATGTVSLSAPYLLSTSTTATSTFNAGIDATRVCLKGTTTCLAASSSGGSGKTILTINATSSALSGGVNFKLATSTPMAAGDNLDQIYARIGGYTSGSPNQIVDLDVVTSQGTTTIDKYEWTGAGNSRYGSTLMGHYTATTSVTANIKLVYDGAGGADVMAQDISDWFAMGWIHW